MPIRLRLKQLRERRGLTQRQLARRAGLRQPWIAKVETGRIRVLDLAKLARLADALGVPAARLLDHTPRRRR